jgi:riboflavin synthase
MFTGLVEETGKIIDIRTFDGGLEFDIQADKVMEDLVVDHSISINGACQTVIRHEKNIFTIQSIKETLEKTAFNDFEVGTTVNLERAMKADTRLGGHFVQGHVNGTGNVESIESRGENYLIGIKLHDDLYRFCIMEGSITIDGISLTIADMKDDVIYVSIIPHTWEVTNMSGYEVGRKVNVEVDMLAKYLFRFMETMKK